MLIYDGQTFLGGFGGESFKLFFFFSVLGFCVHRAYQNLNFIPLQLPYFLRIIYSRICTIVYFFLTDSWLTVSEASQTLFKYYKRNLAKQVLPFWFRKSFFKPKWSLLMFAFFVCNWYPFVSNNSSMFDWSSQLFCRYLSSLFC